MSAELNRCYELLGVKPGASVAELKAAYRDMAKVWHPDRFGHDERLQKKAQDKLKEINEAYELLVSGKIPRPRPAANGEASRAAGFESSASPTPQSKPMRWQWAVVPLMIFVAVFFAVSQLRKSSPQLVEPAEQTSEAPTAQTAQADPESKQAATEQRTKSRQETAETQGEVPVSQPAAAQNAAAAPVQPMATVTVLIDPSTGLLAKADCPTKTKVTYPAGNEPHGYCNVAHGAKTQGSDSSAKTIAKRVVSPGKWLGSGKEGDRQE